MTQRIRTYCCSGKSESAPGLWYITLLGDPIVERKDLMRPADNVPVRCIGADDEGVLE